MAVAKCQVSSVYFNHPSQGNSTNGERERASERERERKRERQIETETERQSVCVCVCVCVWSSEVIVKSVYFNCHSLGNSD